MMTPLMTIQLCIGLPILALAFLSPVEGSVIQPKSKRQIYREQVLPSKGGKIPESAFLTDRLALNRLNKEGISIPDGVLLEHRKIHIHPHINQHDPEDEASLIRIHQRPEDRYVSPEGRYRNRNLPTVASTYLIRRPVGPDNSMLRSPENQVPVRTYDQASRNRVPSRHHFVTGPSRIPQRKFPGPHDRKPEVVPSRKYLPSGPSDRTNVQRLPPSEEYFFGGRPPTIVRHPHPLGYEAPVSYQSVSYYPIARPLEIPNRQLSNDVYYRVKGLTGNGVVASDEFSNAIDWPSLLEEYSQISGKINVYHQDSYQEPIRHSQFFNPQVLGSVDSGSNYYSKASSGRFARKSKEISFTESGSDSKEFANEEKLQFIKIQCSGGTENAVHDGSTQC